MTFSRSPQCRAVLDESSLSPLFPTGGVGGGNGYGKSFIARKPEDQMFQKILIVKNFKKM